MTNMLAQNVKRKIRATTHLSFWAQRSGVEES